MKTYTLKLNEKQIHTTLFAIMAGITNCRLRLAETPSDAFYVDLLEKLQDSQKQFERVKSDREHTRILQEEKEFWENEKRLKDEYRDRD